MLRNKSFNVALPERGVRLDTALQARFPTASRAFCRQAVESGRVQINGRTAFKGYKLRPGDVVTIDTLKERYDNRVQPDPSVQVELVFEDTHLLAVNKPAGQPVHPLASEERGTLMNGLVARYPELAALGDQPLMAGALHRIDTDTSGLVLAARTAEAFSRLRAQFAAQQVEKFYLALVEGHIATPGRLMHDLTHHPDLPLCKMVDSHTLTYSAQPRVFHAQTAYQPLEFVGPYTLLEVTIWSGVTHQIRCQLALGGWPIVNDTLYGAHPVAGSTRHFLHASAASFIHPASGQPCRVEAPLAHAFEPFVQQF